MSIEMLVGKTILSITKGSDPNDTWRDDEGLIFVCDDGSKFWMGHFQSCCESVYIEDQNGDWEDILNTPILVAEERSNMHDSDDDLQIEWTFYTFRTIKGSVDLRWYGSSNGYYGTGVSFSKID